MVAQGKQVIIALDAMGGDNAPSIVLEGADKALTRYPHAKFLLFGDKNRISYHLDLLPNLKSNSTVIHTESFISADEKPSVALRKGTNSSMRLAINAVKEGQAAAVVSAGNTGALMAMSKLMLRTLPGIDRPAIASIFPNKIGRCILLDLGANVDCNSDNLVQFALMGDAFAKVVLGLKSPRVALLNVGAEETKGSEVVKLAAEDLRDGDYPINFCGYVEGDDIAEGAADVIVTDGFTGNVALKTAEGTAKMCVSYMKKSFKSSPLAMLGGLLAYRAIKKTFESIDPRMHNGAMFLGLNGISVKSHGGTDGLGFSNAISIAIQLAENNINKKISDELAVHQESFALAADKPVDYED